jgi:hypothetical protein
VLFDDDDDDGTIEQNIYTTKHCRLQIVTKIAGSEPGRINLCHLHEVYGICGTANEVDNSTHDRL